MTDSTEEVRLDPEPGILIESLRDIGYSFNSALADIIDNSISANATEVIVLALPIEHFMIGIIDNGEGLCREELKQSMRLGSSDPRQERALNDLGRFGLGLKTASFSQCRRLTVASRRNGQLSAFTWDLDLVVSTNSWHVIEYSDATDIPLVDQIGENGTLVLWENLDRLTGAKCSGKTDYDRIISEAQDYLSLVFHRYLAGEHDLTRISIKVNNQTLDPIDPFNTSNKATQSSPTEVICPGVTMQVFTLPHRSNYSSAQEYEKYGLQEGYLRSQGVYLRAKRLILYGTWFGLARKTALTQLSRVKIDIGVNQDELWKIDVKKVSAQMPEAVRTRVKALIATIGAPSRKVYRHRGTVLTSPELFPTWNSNREGDKTVYTINRDNPIIKNFRESLGDGNARSFDMVLGVIESAFPREALFYDLSVNEESVAFKSIGDDELAEAARTFFGSLKQQGHDEDVILSIMKSADPFRNRWADTLEALGGIKETQ
ncbi:ATP-binding protein [Thermophilibacter immobilis]|jgi:hypothetical protein|uniref:ATP-binding protein n=1 Tax=Thermophilibacter immobilis TaxID=2779519 RepID=A0A7S7M8H1_9ACTN|nr:ATP-binding protein [Thermophilibacter immobilis]QOY60629.1 ATP-binding protein [Thermophilibacter immobilis]